MNNTFKAAVLTKLNEPLEIVEIMHQPAIEGQVKIKMITSGLCGAQVNEMTGKKGDDKYLPHLMGHEGYGEVVQVGPDVSRVQVGDNVVIHWRPSNGLGMSGISYTSVDDLAIGAGPCTTFAEYTIVAENRCTKIKKDDSLTNILPLLGCAVSTAFGAVTKEAKVSKDDSILIFGAGGLGMALLFWCKVFGFSKVDVVDIHEGKRNQVSDFNGNLILANELDNTTTYDKIFETSGVVSNIERSLSLANKGANIVLIGQPRIGSSVKFDDFLHLYDDINLIPSMGGHFSPDTDMPLIYNACIANPDLVNLLVSKNIKLDEINEGFLEMKSPTSKRIILDFAGENNDQP
jgi:Zn-dependent alcohol dehydrogenase